MVEHDTRRVSVVEAKMSVLYKPALAKLREVFDGP
jgi:hypothetical protein